MTISWVRYTKVLKRRKNDNVSGYWKGKCLVEPIHKTRDKSTVENNSTIMVFLASQLEKLL